MLGRKSYTKSEIDRAKEAVASQLRHYDDLVAKVGAAKGAKAAVDTTDAFSARYFNDLALVLDRTFVHRIRSVTGKDGTPLNELELLCDGIIDHGGQLQKSTVIKLDPDTSVTKIGFGEQIVLTRDQFEQLAAGCFAELEAKYL